MAERTAATGIRRLINLYKHKSNAQLPRAEMPAGGKSVLSADTIGETDMSSGSECERMTSGKARVHASSLESIEPRRAVAV
jgi:hypothetical protein